MDAEPLADGELAALFAPVSDARRITLAVSGGADSLALLDAVDRWRRLSGDAPEAVVLTVDHRLRESATGEAERVVAIARERGLAARLLTWQGPHPAADIEGAARRARYRLLVGETRLLLATHLLVAHHRDDQAETFLMRLRRGSGVFGLAAMRSAVRAGDITILRPFLDLPRTRLAATAAAAGLVPVEDVMNADPRFERARLRRIMPLLAAEGFGPEAIVAAAGRMALAADAIDHAVDRLVAEAVGIDALAVASIAAEDFAGAPEAVRRRFLVRLLAAIGGGDYPPPRARLAALEGAMLAAREGARFKRTLAGSVIERRAGRFLAYRESGRAGLPAIALPGGYSGTWDHRFRVVAPRRGLDGLSLGPLGESGRRALGLTVEGTPAAALAALPAIRQGERIVAVPSVGQGSLVATAHGVTVTPILGERLAEPRRFPDLTD